MDGRREQLWVGTFVLAAAAVLVAVVLAVSGSFHTKGVTYRTYFRYAAGLAPAAPVRYGGLMAGKVEALRVDPDDPARIEIEFRVRPGIPMKTDSVAKITALGALGESYLEVTAGKNDSPAAQPGSVIPSHEMTQLADLGDMIGGLVPTAQGLLKNLDDRVTEMKTTVASVNDLLGEPNRKNVSASLAELHTMLAETRPKISATLDNVQSASARIAPILKNMQTATERLTPVLENLQKTVQQANEALGHVDGMLTENRPDIRASMQEIRKTVETASKAVELLRAALERNADNLDDSLANVRTVTDNLKEMTDTLKRKPSVLIRGETGKDRQPGATK